MRSRVSYVDSRGYSARGVFLVLELRENEEGGKRMKPFFEIVLAGLPPTVNRMYRSRGGRVYKARVSRVWQDAAAVLIQDAWDGQPYEGDVELRIYLGASTRRRWDIDNRVKAVQDCLQAGGVLVDDCQVQVLRVERFFVQPAQTRLELYTWEEKNGAKTGV